MPEPALAPDGVLDDATRRYILAAQPVFDDLRDVAAQLAGLMVLAGSGASSAAIDHPMVQVAAERWRGAREGARALRAPAAAAHHHHHLVRTAEIVGRVLGAVRDDAGLVGRLGTPLPLLNAAWREVEHTAAALPGFRTLDLTQACCAIHAKQRQGLITCK